ncbi:MAG: hypothetical protein MUC35_05710 [Candidatus Margulisbacteria bacterium]|nr:hypothetical protein [Candidatus Margulisiibacteriota bacterium]
MKKIVLAACLLLLIASLSIAEGIKYQIISERTGFLGMGAKRTLMLDKETGNSWVFDEGKWVPIPRAEDQLRAEQEKVRFEAEINDLRAKQAAEIDQLKAKQEAELKILQAKNEEPKVLEVSSQTMRSRTSLRKPTRAKTVVTAKAKTVDEAETGEEGPPAWLTD